MAQPTKYIRIRDYSQDEGNSVAGRNTILTASLDAELDAIKSSTDQIIDNIALLQRDDGKLKNESVHADALSAAVLALINGQWTAKGVWITTTAYVVNDMISENNDAYVCLEAHTAGTFATDLAAGKWFRIGQLSYAELASTVNGKGASLVGVEDVAGNFTAKNMEGVLVEIVATMVSNAVIAVSQVHGKRIAQVPLLAVSFGIPYLSGRSSTIAVGNSPHGVAFDGTHLWVTNSAANTVSKIDIATDTVVATVAVGTGPRGAVYDGAHLWVANGADNTVSKIDITTNSVVATVAVGTLPEGVAFDGTHIWVANTTSNNVSKIDITTDTVVATVSIGFGALPSGVAFDGTHIWVANTAFDNVSKINIATDTVVATVAVGTSPIGVTFDGTHIWVANNSTNNVSKIDIATDTVVATVAVGTVPHGVAFDGTHLWVTNSAANTVSKIDITTNTVVATIATGTIPYNLAFDGTHMWVANNTANNVSKILAR